MIKIIGSIILNLILIIIDVYIIKWIYNIYKNNCRCAINKNLVLIRDFWLFILFLDVTNIIFDILLLFNFKTNFVIKYNLIGFLYFHFVFLGLFHLYNIYITYIYIIELDNNKCECANKTLYRDMIYYYSIMAGVVSMILTIIYTPLLYTYLKHCGIFKSKNQKCLDIYNKNTSN